MRQEHSTLTSRDVRETAEKVLARAVPLKGYGLKVSAHDLVEVLLLVAALTSSLSAVVRRFAFGFSHETARKALNDNLSDVDKLNQGLVDALYFCGSRALRRRRWDVALDIHYCPFYGQRPTPGVIGGQKKQGSKWHYAYATAVLIHRRHRYTVGLLPLTDKFKAHEVVRALLEQMAKHGLKLRGVVLDSGFDSGETILLLQDKKLSYTIPLRKKGRGNNRRNACFALPLGTITEIDWVTDESRKPVTTRVVVQERAQDNKVMVYAFAGWGADEATGRWRQAARLAGMAYRRRFGIETSYRQANQGKGTTTKKDVKYRLLLFGLALLLRQVWVWLSGQMAKQQRLRPKQWLSSLPFVRLLTWLADELKSLHPEEKSIPLSSPLLPLDNC
jgi:Transposase DDE domain